MQERRMIEGEMYVDFKERLLNIVGYLFCELQVGNTCTRKARFFRSKGGTNSIIEKERPPTPKFCIAHPSVDDSDNNVPEEKEEKLGLNTKMYMKMFPNLFSRSGKIENHRTSNKI